MTTATDEKRFGELLDAHDLKKTRARLNILSVIDSREAATSQPTLEKLLGQEIDSVTLYRALKTFEEKGIIHKVIDANGTANYAMCSAACNDHDHHDEHMHFNCTVCYNVYCLDTFQIPKMNMPKGFTAATVNLTAYGVCENCNRVKL